jgi:hypothetical protein
VGDPAEQSVKFGFVYLDVFGHGSIVIRGGLMTIQRVCLFRCSNAKCSIDIVLPRQSHLGQFDDLANPATGIWPITYLCQRCGRVSEVPAEAIRQEISGTRDRGPLFRYDFSNGRPDSPARFVIYTQENKPDTVNAEDARQAVERILKPSGLWRESYGPVEHIAIDAINRGF